MPSVKLTKATVGLRKYVKAQTTVEFVYVMSVVKPTIVNTGVLVGMLTVYLAGAVVVLITATEHGS